MRAPGAEGGWWLHDLRRTLATALQRLGVRLEVTETAAAEGALSWAKRRLQEVRSRSVVATVAEVELVKEAEPNDEPAQANTFRVPAVLEGTIGRPGDIDRYRFKAKAGEIAPLPGGAHQQHRVDTRVAPGFHRTRRDGLQY